MRRGMVLLGLCLFQPGTGLAEEAAEDPLVEMVVELLNDKDPDMRALGFEQVRSGVKGKVATKRLAGLLPTLPPEAKAGLLVALGDRGDCTARPCVLAILRESTETTVRVAAIRALGRLGEADDVPLLVRTFSDGSDAERPGRLRHIG